MRFHKLEECLRSSFGRSMLGPGNGTADFSDVIRESQKFYAGEVCLLDNIAQPKDIPRLPYPLCTFEFREDMIVGGDLSGLTSSYFIIAEEVGASAPELDGVIRIHFFCGLPIALHPDKFWAHFGWVNVDRQTNKYDSFLNKNTVKRFSEIFDAQMIERSIIAGSHILFRFLSVLNCSNIEVSETPAPLALNKKRLAKRKVPIYSYKTLVVKGVQKRFLAAARGTHEAPRIHLRRGHIKRRKTGNFWWEPCVVGDRKKGIVVKDYRADGLASLEKNT
jgi:hypothetical protein